MKLDGYIALMSHLDWPHLRRDALAAWRQQIGRLIFGGHLSDRFGQELPRWLPWLGAGSAIFPLVLLLQATRLWFGLVLLNGRVGGLFVLTILGLLAFGAGRGLLRLVIEARERGSSRARIASGMLASFALAIIGAMSVQVPLSIEGGYWIDGDEIAIILPDGSESLVEPGLDVELSRRGVLPGVTVVPTTVTDARPQPASVPMAAMLGVDYDLDFEHEQTYRARIPDEPVAPTGRVMGDAGDLSIADWFYQRYIVPAWEAAS